MVRKDILHLKIIIDVVGTIYVNYKIYSKQIVRYNL